VGFYFIWKLAKLKVVRRFMLFLLMTLSVGQKYIASNGGMTTKYSNGKHVEGENRTLFEVLNGICLEGLRRITKTSVRLTGFRFGICGVLYTKQECWQLEAMLFENSSKLCFVQYIYIYIANILMILAAGNFLNHQHTTVVQIFHSSCLWAWSFIT
jgi:hypothetical protein